MEYNKKIDEILDNWQNASINKGYNGFCRDGLMYKGEIQEFIDKNDGKTKYCRKKGNENQLWNDYSKKVVFLVKDTNQNPDHDYREWLGRQSRYIITHRFFKNIALWLYGLHNFNLKGEFPVFEEAFVPENYSSAFDNTPFAIVNCKKESGVGTISDTALWNYCEIFGEFLKQQIDVLNPDIIVCCGGTYSIVRKIATDIIYPDLVFEKLNDKIYYNKEYNKVLIESYHPSARASYKSMYDALNNAYTNFKFLMPKK